jgi:hypothetical protein
LFNGEIVRYDLGVLSVVLTAEKQEISSNAQRETATAMIIMIFFIDASPFRRNF